MRCGHWAHRTLYLMMSHMVLKKEEQNVNNTKYADSRSTGDIQKEQTIYIMAEQQKMVDSQTNENGNGLSKDTVLQKESTN